MTVESTATREFSIGAIVLQAFRRAGLVSIYSNLTQQQMSAGVNELELILKRLAASGFLARKVGWQTLTIRAGVWQYSLSEDVLDVLGTAMYSDPDQPVTQMSTPDVVGTVSNVELPVSPVLRDAYQRLSAKAAQGRPVLYFPERTGAQVVAYVWPVPSVTEDQGSIRFQVHRWRADASDPNATADVERYWEDYLVWEIAHRLAVSSALNINRAGYLAGQASQAMIEAKAMSYQNANQRLKLAHRTGWRRR